MSIILEITILIILIILFIFESYKNIKYGHRLTAGELIRRFVSYYSLLVLTFSLIGSIFLLFFFIFNISLKHFIWLIISLIILYASKKVYDKNKLWRKTSFHSGICDANLRHTNIEKNMRKLLCVCFLFEWGVHKMTIFWTLFIFYNFYLFLLYIVFINS